MSDFAGNKKAAAQSRGTHVERKEFRRRIRLMSRKELSFSLTYIVYQIFRLAQIFLGFFLPAMDGGGILYCWLNFCRQFCKKKKLCDVCTARGTPRGKGLFFHKYSLTQNMSNCKRQMVSYAFSISYFLQNTTAKPQKLLAKKTDRNKCSLFFLFRQSSAQPANSCSILPATSRLSSSIANAQISRIKLISFLRLRLNENPRQQILSMVIIASTPSSIRFGIKNVWSPYLISYTPPSSLSSISSWNIFLTTSGSRRIPSFVSGITVVIFVIIFCLLSFCFPALPTCNLHLQYAGFCRPQNIGRISAERKSPAAGKDNGALKQRKERTRRRIRLMYLGRFLFLISYI